VLFRLFQDVAPASPFIASKERARVTFVVKRRKMRKDEREKQKKWHRAWPSSSLCGGNSLPCSAEMQQALIFWPFRLLVLRAMATLRPFASLCHRG
jgi:hypothetical protein